jgi:hypothetical protein
MSKLDFVETDFEDLSCHTGATFNVDILVTEQCTNLPNDLAGYTARLVIFDDLESTVIDTITGTIATPANGTINFNIPATTTATYTIGLYSYHLELLIDTTVTRLGQGFFEVTA